MAKPKIVQKKSEPVTPVDACFDALTKIVAVLRPLDKDAQRRVLEAVQIMTASGSSTAPPIRPPHREDDLAEILRTTGHYGQAPRIA